MDCLLYTLDGTKEAFSSPAHYPHICKITPKDGSGSILVGEAMHDYKFEQSTKPTFYAC